MIRRFLSLVLILCSCFANAGAIIVHKDNDSEISQQDIIEIYFAYVETFPNGNSAVPLDQARRNEIRGRFTSDVLETTLFKLKAHYTKLLFTGKGQPPREAMSDEDVVRLVAANHKLIGYVDTLPENADVRVVLQF